MEIGYFGDVRLARGGALIARRVSERQTVCLRKLSDDRAEQVSFDVSWQTRRSRSRK
jgi:hypothetical protein